MVDERDLIVIGILQSKIDISPAAGPQRLYRFVAISGDCLHALCESCEGLLADRIKQGGLVLKVQVDRCRRVFDLLGDAPH